MIRHIVAWNLTDKDAGLKIKKDLEELKNKIDYLKEITVYLNSCHTSDRDIVLSILFDKEEDLKRYASDPYHLEVVSYIKTVTEDRVVLDYQE